MNLRSDPTAPAWRPLVLPMANVALIVAALLLLALPGRGRGEADAGLPATALGALAAGPHLEVEVDAAGAVLLDGVEIPADEAVRELAERQRELGGAAVVVRGHREAPYGALRILLEEMRTAQVAPVSLAAGAEVVFPATGGTP
mgnify:CR=1 FL=1